MKDQRLNRSMSSIKSPAPAFAALRNRHAPAFEFRCRCCGEVLQREEEVFDLLLSFFAAASFDAASGQSVREWLEECYQWTCRSEEASAAIEETLKQIDRDRAERATARERSRAEFALSQAKRAADREAWREERAAEREAWSKEQAAKHEAWVKQGAAEREAWRRESEARDEASARERAAQSDARINERISGDRVH